MPRKRGSVDANVFKFLITSKTKKSTFSALEERFATEEDLKNLLSSHPCFWLGEIEQNLWEVRPKVQVELCYRYRTGDCHGDCQKLHFCNENLFSSRFCSRPCKYGFSHNINDAHNKRIADAAFPRYFKDDGGDKIRIIKSSFPRLCKSFTEDGSCNKSFCGYLHICPEYIKERCSGDCWQATISNISKDIAHNFTIEHNKKVLQSFNLSCSKVDRPRLLANILVGNPDRVTVKNTETYNNTRSKNLSSFSMVDISKPSGGARKRRSLSTDAAPKNELIADFNSLKDEGICYKFLNDTCMKGGSCSLRHPDPRLPYLWQYHEGNLWENFSPDVNINMEKCFCDPTKERWKLIISPYKELITDVSQSGPVWMGIYCGIRVGVRRLSTKSSILLEDDEDGNVVVGLTEWKWYWEKNENVWEEYSGTVKSEDVEKSFLNKSTLEYIFETKEFKYAVRFKEMVQQNLDPIYFTKRNVMRRPVFKDIKSIIKSKGLSANQFPSHWPKDFKNGDCISIQDGKVLEEILRNFLTSLGRYVDIISVREVCNRIFHSKYMNTKQNFTERLGDDNMNEKMLFHGTSSDVAPNICAQNFDWRLNGKNATMFGQGSYFARDASYSDIYAKENETGEQCMFLAQVLVGKYTLGNSRMKRPPEDETKPGVLYDCCVNNVSNPSIFVIFERDQCYPKYLIKYREKPKPGFVPQHIHDLNVGMEVDVRGYGLGTIRWIGPGMKSRRRRKKGISLKNIGVELKKPNGDTNGLSYPTRSGIAFYPFYCQPNHGIYVGISSIATAWR